MELEEPEDARIMLSRAVECCPTSVEVSPRPALQRPEPGPLSAGGVSWALSSLRDAWAAALWSSARRHGDRMLLQEPQSRI